MPRDGVTALRIDRDDYLPSLSRCLKYAKSEVTRREFAFMVRAVNIIVEALLVLTQLGVARLAMVAVPGSRSVWLRLSSKPT